LLAEERKAYYEYETLDRTNSILDKSEVKKLMSQGNPRNARNVHSLDADGNFIID
jgi:hypothetical protein